MPLTCQSFDFCGGSALVPLFSESPGFCAITCGFSSCGFVNCSFGFSSGLCTDGSEGSENAEAGGFLSFGGIFGDACVLRPEDLGSAV